MEKKKNLEPYFTPHTDKIISSWPIDLTMKEKLKIKKKTDQQRLLRED